MKRVQMKLLRTPELVKTKRGHVVNKWCGSCKFKEIQASTGGSSEGKRWCTMLNKEVELDDICEEWELYEKLAAL